MGNTYFQFKQFKIEQDKCAMKVTTDACIQGAWTPIRSHVKRVLDIGAGTGLLSLMFAQRNPHICIDAIEFDADAAQQAAENVAMSPWRDRIHIIETDARNFDTTHKYSLIITNPPFFHNSLLGDNEAKNKARHTLSLSFEELVQIITANLADDGYVSILLPYEQYLTWLPIAAAGALYEQEKLVVRHRADAALKRVVGIFSTRKAGDVKITELTIQSDSGTYSQAFIKLLSPFYLNL
jgi:tRNA1Val (adenine37-N6)-methyltransferase